MPDPINYLSQFANIPSPTQAILSGIQTAESLDQLHQKNLQEKQALEAQMQMQKDVAQVYTSPSVQGITGLMVKYPALADKWKIPLESMTAQQKAAKIQQANEIFMPLLTGDRETAIASLERQAAAAKNAGDIPGATSLDMMHKLVSNTETGTAGDNAVLASVGMFLQASMGDDFNKVYKPIMEAKLARDKAPGEMAKTAAEATKLTFEGQKAAVDAEFAQQKAVADLEEKGWNIKKLQAGIETDKINSQIAMGQLAVARANTDIRRQEMQVKVDELKQVRQEKLQEKVATLNNIRYNADNMLNSLDGVLKMYDTDPAAVLNATGPVASKLPTVSPRVADFETAIDSIKAQAFLTQVPQMKAMGQLSNAEGEKLGDALRNLSLRQSASSLKKNLTEAKRLILKARSSAATRYGQPDTVPDTPENPPKVVTVDY